MISPNKRTFRIFVFVLILISISVYMGQNLRLDDFTSTRPRAMLSDNSTERSRNATSSKSDLGGPSFFNPIERGSYIRVGSLDVAIVTAVNSPDFPAKKGFNVFLNGWAHHKSKRNFKCCFMDRLDAPNIELVEVTAATYHMYNQWIVDMQNAEFSCSISLKQMEALAIQNKFNYVTFSEDSCKNAPRNVVKIEYPQRFSQGVAVCLKVSYGSLHPPLIMEWFEYSKVIGVTKVFSFLARDLDEVSLKVFKYYNTTGFLDASFIDPAPSHNGSRRGFKHPRWNQQAYVDEVMAINDCKHRMSGMDYIVVMDVDEFIVPKVEDDNIYTILQKTLQKYPKAGAFAFDSHVAMLDWGYTRTSPLHVMRTTNITTFPNFDGADRNTRWAFIPGRTFFGQNNKAWPRNPYKPVNVLKDLYTLVHRRLCKDGWRKTCLQTNIRKRDETITRYETKMLRNIQQLPLESILTNSTEYIHAIRNWKESSGSLTVPKV